MIITRTTRRRVYELSTVFFILIKLCQIVTVESLKSVLKLLRKGCGLRFEGGAYIIEVVLMMMI